MRKEIHLLDTSRSDREVIFEQRPDGIDLKSFKLDGLKMEVEEVLDYKPWNAGHFNPGAGQVGVYRLHNADNLKEKQIALIKDYRSAYGDWQVVLVDAAETEGEIKQRLMDSELYKRSLRSYLNP